MVNKNNKPNIKVGIGVSYNRNPYKASIEAAKRSLEECEKPNISIVYTNSELDQKEFLKGINDVLGKNWVGVSTDKIFTNFWGYDPKIMIAVLSICSEYMHFSVAVAENYRKDPAKKAYNAVKQAIESIHADKYVDAYIQFTRTRNKDYGNIIRNPPYFILAFISGVKIINGKTIPGRESEFISGILDYTGPNIPVFGGSASSSLEEYIKNKAQNYQFVNGKIYENAAIVVFVVCNLHFANAVTHGYKLTKDNASITKIDKTGYEILEINGKEPIKEYGRALGISKKEYLKDPSKYSFKRPFGLVMEDGTTVVKEAVPNPDNKTLHSNFRLYQNAIMNILDIDNKATIETSKNAIDKITIDKQGKTPAIALFCSCSGRRPLVKDIEKKDLQNLKRKYPKLPFFGFYSFSEVGSSKYGSAHIHSQTVTSLIIYNDLLTEK